MSWSFAFFTWLNAFWVMMFIAIPFSTEYESPREKENSYVYAAAPKKIYWKKVVAIAATLAIIITAMLALVIKSGIIPVKNL